ncbi:MAG: hypothetical protein AAGE59_04220 [Cyanobacteria bacterium P01_F01_bin.86]
MKSLQALLPLLALLAITSPAKARNISTQAATQQKTPIAVEIGTGHTIDFSQTGEQVFRGWIGDGGRCLQLSPSSPLEQGASILYLRRITPCQQISGLPEVSQTTMTLVTLSSADETKIYEFSIDYSATGDSLTRIVPGGVEPREAIERARLALLDPVAVEAGLGKFGLASDSPVATRVQSWLDAVEGGQTQRTAARSISLDWALLQRLEEVGKEPTAEETVSI